MQRFSVSVLVPTINETHSLQTTVDVLLAENAPVLREVVLLTSARTTAATLTTARELARRHGDVVQVRQQRRPGLGGALQDGFAWAQGSHVLMMAADLETCPHVAKDLIARAQGDASVDIVTASRWAHKGGFQGPYAAGQLWLNWAFQRLLRGLYGTRLTDLTYGYRLFRKDSIASIAWREHSHRFLLETLVTPLRLGARVVEVPCGWRARQEGTTDNTVAVKLAYVPMALSRRFARRRSLMHAPREAA